jgi:glycosyltransferase involved in cell wall biosynthesis
LERKKYKIAFLSVFHPFRGGIAQFNTELYKALEVKADLKAFNFTTQYPNFLFPGKTQFVDKKDIAPNFDTTRLLSSINPFSFFATAKAIKKYNPDILITSYWMPFFGPSLGMVCKKLKKKTLNISFVHNAIPHEKRFGDSKLSKLYFKQQHGFVTMSEIVRSDLASVIPNARTMLRPHPLYEQFGELKPKFEMREKFGVKEDQKVLLFFGFIRKYKGLDLLLKALKDCDDNTVVLIAGECYGDFNEYQEIIDELSVSERIINRVQYIPDSEVVDVFSVSDICVLPYRTATQSGIASIAKFYQLPMVVTPVGELPNEVIPNKTGIVCESSKPIHIAFGISKCLDELDSFSSELKAEKEEHNWINFADEFLNFVDSLK